MTYFLLYPTPTFPPWEIPTHRDVSPARLSKIPAGSSERALDQSPLLIHPENRHPNMPSPSHRTHTWRGGNEEKMQGSHPIGPHAQLGLVLGQHDRRAG